MNFTGQKLRVLIVVSVIAFLLIPLTILLISRQQNTLTEASPGTTLSFIPESSSDEPINAASGEEIQLDLLVTPGNGNLVSFVKFVVEFDPEIVAIADTDAFIPNSEAFPEIMEDMTVDDGIVTGSVSVGSDFTKAVKDPTKIGTLTFIAQKNTADSPAVFAYTPESQILSVGEKDNPGENVLSNTGATFLSVTGEQSAPLPPTTEEEASPEESENSEEEAVRPRFPAEIEDGTPGENDTIFAITASFHGIGSSGDSTNSKNSSQSNKDPKKTSRIVALGMWDSEDYFVTEGFANVTYDKSSGKYKGTFATSDPIPDGNYAVTLTAEGYLTAVAEAVTIKEGEQNTLPDLDFIAGDIYPDEVIDILDYNILSDCGYGTTSPLPMDDPKSLYQSDACKKYESRADADLDSNGIIDAKDFNLFLRELATQNRLTLEDETVEEEEEEPTPTEESEE